MVAGTPPLIVLVDDDTYHRDVFADVCYHLNKKIKLELFKNRLELLNYLNLPNPEGIVFPSSLLAEQQFYYS